MGWIPDDDDLSAVVLAAQQRGWIVGPTALLAVNAHERTTNDGHKPQTDERLARRQWLRERIGRIITLDRAGTKRAA